MGYVLKSDSLVLVVNLQRQVEQLKTRHEHFPGRTGLPFQRISRGIFGESA